MGSRPPPTTATLHPVILIEPQMLLSGTLHRHELHVQIYSTHQVIIAYLHQDLHHQVHHDQRCYMR
jgi:hypothetical protein